jgi:hypothetical protein
LPPVERVLNVVELPLPLALKANSVSGHRATLSGAVKTVNRSSSKAMVPGACAVT